MQFLESISLSPAGAAIAFAVVVVGSAVQGSVGFGLGLLAAPVLVMIHPGFIPAPLLGAALVLTVMVIARDRRGIDFRGAGFAFAGRMLGTIPAALLVSAISTTALEVLIGVLVILAVGLSVVGPRITPTPVTTLIAGLVSGFMATIVAIGGPPLALVYQHAGGSRLRATLATLILVGASFSLVVLFCVGRVGVDEVVLMTILLPGIVLGFVASGPLARGLDRGAIRPAVLALSVVASIVVLWRTLA